MSDPFIGQITLFAGNFAPQGYAFCDGQIMSISQNAALYSLLGTTYGGNGTTTFALPDLRGRVPVHSGGGGQGPGLSAYPLGTMTGVEAVTLSSTQMPSHSHSVNATASSGTNSSPAGAVWAAGPAGKGATPVTQYGTAPNATMSASALSPTGGSQPHPNIQPVLALNYIIALQGTYPSRT